MSADPRLVPDAEVLQEITYAEAAELAYAGAKVLHPRTLAPLAEKKIPVWSKNSFAPEKPGTKIVPSVASGTGTRAVASMKNVALSVPGAGERRIERCASDARALDAVARANVEYCWFPAPAIARPSAFWCGKRIWVGRSRRWSRCWPWNWRITICNRSR